MNILLWVLQAMLTFLLVGGGITKAFKFDMVAAMPAMSALPRVVWNAIGILELVAAVLMIVPGLLSWMPHLTPLAASVVAIECLAISALYGRHSLEIAATNPMVWSAAMTVLAAIIAYGRYNLSPLS
jgi:hypothetical protein